MSARRIEANRSYINSQILIEVQEALPERQFNPADLSYGLDEYGKEEWNPRTAQHRINHSVARLEPIVSPTIGGNQSKNFVDSLRYQSDAQALIDGHREALAGINRLSLNVARDLNPEKGKVARKRRKPLRVAAENYANTAAIAEEITKENIIFLSEIQTKLEPDPRPNTGGSEVKSDTTTVNSVQTQILEEEGRERVFPWKPALKAVAGTGVVVLLLSGANSDKAFASNENSNHLEMTATCGAYDLNQALRQRLADLGVNPEEVLNQAVNQDSDEESSQAIAMNVVEQGGVPENPDEPLVIQVDSSTTSSTAINIRPGWSTDSGNALDKQVTHGSQVMILDSFEHGQPISGDTNWHKIAVLNENGTVAEVGWISGSLFQLNEDQIEFAQKFAARQILGQADEANDYSHFYAFGRGQTVVESGVGGPVFGDYDVSAELATTIDQQLEEARQNISANVAQQFEGVTPNFFTAVEGGRISLLPITTNEEGGVTLFWPMDEGGQLRQNPTGYETSQLIALNLPSQDLKFMIRGNQLTVADAYGVILLSLDTEADFDQDNPYASFVRHQNAPKYLVDEFMSLVAGTTEAVDDAVMSELAGLPEDIISLQKVATSSGDVYFGFRQYDQQIYPSYRMENGQWQEVVSREEAYTSQVPAEFFELYDNIYWGPGGAIKGWVTVDEEGNHRMFRPNLLRSTGRAHTRETLERGLVELQDVVFVDFGEEGQTVIAIEMNSEQMKNRPDGNGYENIVWDEENFVQVIGEWIELYRPHAKNREIRISLIPDRLGINATTLQNWNNIVGMSANMISEGNTVYVGLYIANAISGHPDQDPRSVNEYVLNNGITLVLIGSGEEVPSIENTLGMDANLRAEMLGHFNPVGISEGAESAVKIVQVDRNSH